MLQFFTTSSLSRMLNILLDISFLPPFLPFFINTAAKRLRMRQIEHFRSLFQSHFPELSSSFQSKSPARFILCAACGSVVLLYAARVLTIL